MRLLSKRSKPFYCNSVIILLMILFALNSVFAQQKKGEKDDKAKDFPSIALADTLYKRASSNFSNKKRDLSLLQLDSVIQIYTDSNLISPFSGDAYYLKGLVFYYQNNNAKAVEQYQKAISIYLNVDSNYYFLPEVYRQISNTIQDNPDESLAYLEQSVRYAEKIYHDDPQLLAKNHYSALLRKYYRRGFHKKTIDLVKKIQGMFEEVGDPENYRMFSIYNYLGLNHKNSGEYVEALDCYDKSLRILSKHDSSPSYEAAIVLGNIGVVHMIRDENELALQHILRSEQIIDSVYQVGGRLKKSKSATTLVQKANAYIKLGEIETAKKVLLELIDFTKKQYGDQSTRYYIAVKNYAVALLNNQELDEALNSFNQLDSLVKKLYLKSDAKQVAQYYMYRGEIFAKQGLFNRSIQAFDRAEKLLEEYIKQPQADQIGNLKIIDLYKSKAEMCILRHQQNQDLSLLEQAKEQYDLALDKLHQIRANQIYDRSKLDIAQRNYQLFADAIDVNQLLYQQTQNQIHWINAFNIAEQSKNVLLGSKLNNSLSLNMGGVPQEQLNLLSKIDYQINFLQEKIRKTESDSLIPIWQEEVFQLKKEKNQKYQSFAAHYPRFYQLKTKQPKFSLEEIQLEFLDDQELLLEYFIHNDDLYVFGLSKQFKYFRKDSLSAEHKEQLKVLSFGNNLISTNSKFNYEAQKGLSQLLLAGLEKHGDQIKKITIIPDGELRFLSFDLLTHPNRAGTFLIQDYQIAYLNALHSKQFQDFQDGQSDKLFAGFAPSYEEFNPVIAQQFFQTDRFDEAVRSGVQLLPGAIQEVQQITELLNGDVFLKEQASETNFKALADQYRLLHLSMHTLPIDEMAHKSNLIFQANSDTTNDGFLELEEIYNLKLNADLAVLSACNTGFGKSVKGEGVLSLSHAFAYAGVKSTVMSLWKVPDEATSKIMIRFYEHLQAGNEKSEALRLAKLDYLNNVVAEQQKHPFYWAGFVLSGDDTPINFQIGWPLWLKLSLIGLVGIGLLWYFLKNK